MRPRLIIVPAIPDEDAYSFRRLESYEGNLDTMYATYGKIFSRMGTIFRINANRPVLSAVTSHEFQVLAQSGED